MLRAVLGVLIVATLAVGAFAAPLALAAEERSATYPFDFHLAEHEARSFQFDVSETNVTSLDFALTWSETDDKLAMSGPDKFQLVVVEPSGREAPGSPVASDSGELHVALAVPQGASGAAVGAWQITVTLLDCANQKGVKSDTGNDAHLEITMRFLDTSKMRVVKLAPSSATPAGSFAEPSYWGYATMGLGVAAVGLGGIAIQRTRPKK
ncbi:MAG: hypothetical protein ACYDCK_13355 [Thermoplasmatota archaeon]